MPQGPVNETLSRQFAVSGDDGLSDAFSVAPIGAAIGSGMQLGGAQNVAQIDRTFIVRHGKENDEALTLEAGSVEATSWHGDLLKQGIDTSKALPAPAGDDADAMTDQLEALSAKLAKLEARAA